MDAAHIYWLEQVPGTLLACSVGNCANTTMQLDASGKGRGLVIDVQAIYYAIDDKVFRPAKPLP